LLAFEAHITPPAVLAPQRAEVHRMWTASMRSSQLCHISHASDENDV
jgi:hypothetical protein